MMSCNTIKQMKCLVESSEIITFTIIMNPYMYIVCGLYCIIPILFFRFTMRDDRSRSLTMSQVVDKHNTGKYYC